MMVLAAQLIAAQAELVIQELADLSTVAPEEMLMMVLEENDTRDQVALPMTGQEESVIRGPADPLMMVQVAHVIQVPAAPAETAHLPVNGLNQVSLRDAKSETR